MPPAKQAMLTAEQIFEASDLKDEVIEVPEWGGSVQLRTLTLDQQIEAREASMVKGELDLTLFELNLLVRSMVDPDLSIDRIQQLKAKSGPVIRTLIQRVYALNSVTGSIEDGVASFLD